MFFLATRAPTVLLTTPIRLFRGGTRPNASSWLKDGEARASVVPFLMAVTTPLEAAIKASAWAAPWNSLTCVWRAVTLATMAATSAERTSPWRGTRAKAVEAKRRNFMGGEEQNKIKRMAFLNESGFSPSRLLTNSNRRGGQRHLAECDHGRVYTYFGQALVLPLRIDGTRRHNPFPSQAICRWRGRARGCHPIITWGSGAIDCKNKGLRHPDGVLRAVKERLGEASAQPQHRRKT